LQNKIKACAFAQAFILGFFRLRASEVFHSSDAIIRVRIYMFNGRSHLKKQAESKNWKKL